MNEKDLKLTDLDYAIADHHLQMMKAALPYMEIDQQRTMSMYIKWNELMRTRDFFEENGDGMISICSLDENHVSPTDMLTAVKPYANQREQEIIDLLARLLTSRGKNPAGRSPLSFEQLKAVLPPEQQARFESMQMMIQTMQAMGQL